MITFKEYVKKIFGEEIVGIYPPQYGGVGQYPPLANQTGPDQVYVKASRNSLKKKRRKKKKN
jgi:hypothetical protein